MYVGKYGRTDGASVMKRKMTVVFHDEDLYTRLKIEAVKKRTAASEIVAEAVREWLEVREDAELIPVIEDARKEWQEKGGIPWEEVENRLENSINHSARVSE
jgi:hypothetical protein